MFHKVTKTYQMAEWQKVFETDSSIRAEIIKGILAEKGINAIIMNKTESVYQIHRKYELMVSSRDALLAINVIKNEITF